MMIQLSSESFFGLSNLRCRRLSHRFLKRAVWPIGASARHKYLPGARSEFQNRNKASRESPTVAGQATPAFVHLLLQRRCGSTCSISLKRADQRRNVQNHALPQGSAETTDFGSIQFSRAVGRRRLRSYRRIEDLRTGQVPFTKRSAGTCLSDHYG